MLAAVGMLLTACADKSRFASVEAFCDELPVQDYAVKGATGRDQAWIDDTGEAVIAGCKRERPKQRPIEWDAKPVAAGNSQPVQPKKKPRSILDILRRKNG